MLVRWGDMLDSDVVVGVVVDVVVVVSKTQPQ